MLFKILISHQWYVSDSKLVFSRNDDSISFCINNVTLEEGKYRKKQVNDTMKTMIIVSIELYVITYNFKTTFYETNRTLNKS